MDFLEDDDDLKSDTYLYFNIDEFHKDPKSILKHRKVGNRIIIQDEEGNTRIVLGSSHPRHSMFSDDI